jgi:hypothetical protein
MQCRACSYDVPLGAALCPNCGSTQPKTERPPGPDPVAVDTASAAGTGAGIVNYPAGPYPSDRSPTAPPKPRIDWLNEPSARPVYTAEMATRSSALILSVLGLFVLGGVFAYSLPAISADPYGSVSLREVEQHFPRAWLCWMAHLGIAAAAVAAVAYDTSNRRSQAWWITAGCVVMLPFVISLCSTFDELAVPVHLGSGIWLAMVCFAIAAIVPWVLLKQAE